MDGCRWASRTGRVRSSSATCLGGVESCRPVSRDSTKHFSGAERVPRDVGWTAKEDASLEGGDESLWAGWAHEAATTNWWVQVEGWVGDEAVRYMRAVTLLLRHPCALATVSEAPPTLQRVSRRLGQLSAPYDRLSAAQHSGELAESFLAYTPCRWPSQRGQRGDERHVRRCKSKTTHNAWRLHSTSQ